MKILSSIKNLLKVGILLAGLNIAAASASHGQISLDYIMCKVAWLNEPSIFAVDIYSAGQFSDPFIDVIVYKDCTYFYSEYTNNSYVYIWKDTVADRGCDTVYNLVIEDNAGVYYDDCYVEGIVRQDMALAYSSHTSMMVGGTQAFTLELWNPSVENWAKFGAQRVVLRVTCDSNLTFVNAQPLLSNEGSRYKYLSLPRDAVFTGETGTYNLAVKAESSGTGKITVQMYNWEMYTAYISYDCQIGQDIVLEIPIFTTPPHSTPQNLTATARSDATIKLEWTAVSDVGAEYELVRRKESGNYVSVITLPQSTTTYNDTGLETATTYTYRVCTASRTRPASPFSNEASATTLGEFFLSGYAAWAFIFGFDPNDPSVVAGGSSNYEKYLQWLNSQNFGCQITRFEVFSPAK